MPLWVSRVWLFLWPPPYMTLTSPQHHSRWWSSLASIFWERYLTQAQGMKQESLPSYLQLTYARFPLPIRAAAMARPSKGRGHDMDRSGPQPACRRSSCSGAVFWDHLAVWVKCWVDRCVREASDVSTDGRFLCAKKTMCTKSRTVLQ